MDQATDTNAAIWKSGEHVQNRATKADELERKNAAQRQLMGELLPFGEQDAFAFLDLGSGTSSVATVCRRPDRRTTKPRPVTCVT